MTRLLVDPATDFDDPAAVTLTATLLDPGPAIVRTFEGVTAATVVDLPAPGTAEAWRLTIRRPRTTTTRWGTASTDPGPIVEERTVHFAGTGPVAWAALTDVDPATLQTPPPGGETAWEALIKDLRTDIAAGGGGGGGGAVASVNAKTGAVVLGPTDVGADPAGAATTAQAFAVQRANHTGTQSADTLTDGTTAKAFLAAERAKLAGIAAGATVNRADTATDAAIAAATAALVNSAPGTLDTLGELAAALTADEGTAATLATLVATKAPLASPAFTGTPTGITKAHVGLGLVDNTPDTAKPVSTAQAAADALALAKASNLADLASASAARTNLGLGTAAVQPSTAFEAAGAVAAIRLAGAVNAITGNATAVIGVRNTVNAAAGPVTVTLPTPTALGQQLIIERADTSTTNAITITGTIRGSAGATATLAAVGVANEGALWIAESLTSWVPVSIKPKAVLDASYQAKATGTPAAGTYVDGGTGAWTALPAGSGGGQAAFEGLAVIKPPIGGVIASPITSTSGQAPAIGTLHLGMLYLPGGTYSTVVCRVNSPVAGATVKMVAYKADPNNILGTLLFDTAAVAATNGGYLSITLPSALVVADPGYPVWVGLVNQGTAAANFWYGSAGLGLPYIYSAGGSADLNNNQPLGVAITGVTGAAPTSPTGVTTGYLGGAPRIGMLRSA